MEAFVVFLSYALAMGVIVDSMWIVSKGNVVLPRVI